VSRAPTGGLVVLGLLGLALAGCHGFEPTVRRGMSGDVKCPEDKIEVKPLASGGYEASGCGKSQIYDCSWPEGGKRTCTARGVPPPKTLPGTGF
jgi:hypothetical protein